MRDAHASLIVVPGIELTYLSLLWYLPEACNYRKINNEICIASIQQLKARQITLSEIEYKQLVEHIKDTFTQEINQKMEGINFEHLDVEGY